MRYLGVGLCGIVVVSVGAVIALGQGGRGGGQKLPAPTDMSLFSSAAEQKAIGQELAAMKEPAAEHRFFRGVSNTQSTLSEPAAG